MAAVSQKPKAEVKAGEMGEEMQEDAIRLAQDALERTKVEMEIARYIKRGFDYKYPPPWHCVVGRKFGSYVTHESGNFVYFFIENLAILLFKSRN